MVEVPWKEGVAGRGWHAILDEAELQRRIDAEVRRAVEEMRDAAAAVAQYQADAINWSDRCDAKEACLVIVAGIQALPIGR